MAATVRAGHEDPKAEAQAPPSTTQTKAWKQLKGRAKDIGCGADKTYIISDKNEENGNFSVQRRKGNRFIDYDDGKALRLDVDDTGMPWVIQSIDKGVNGAFYYHTGKEWIGPDGKNGDKKYQLMDIAEGGGQLLAIDAK